jgi:glucose-6-phosphate isomerase
MFAGEPINTTEGRAVLHVALPRPTPRKSTKCSIACWPSPKAFATPR